ncbi:MAG: hypothetical protein DRN78_02910 [Thermoproteota archaeon]|nr:MAG: hypothetical protein DRN78_02910 [Candidatus Korarchaeota archaeon]
MGVYDLSITLDDGVNVISSLFPRMVTIYPLQEVYPLGENTTTTTTTQPSSEPDIISVSREHAFEIFMMILMLLIFLQLLKRKEEEFSSFVRHSFSRMFQHSKIREEG